MKLSALRQRTAVEHGNCNRDVTAAARLEKIRTGLLLPRGMMMDRDANFSRPGLD